MINNTIENKNVKDFIQVVLINNIGKLVNDGNHYLGFGTQTQAIELIGAIIEDEDVEKQQPNIKESEFNTKNKSRRRFHNALKLFSNPKYIEFCPESSKDSSYQKNYDLYDNLRCGYAHQMRQCGNISVTTEKESIQDGTIHLEINNATTNLIIVSEILYRDLKEACEKVIKMIDDRQINHAKAYNNFLGIITFK